MVGYSYMQMGMLEAFAGFFTYIIAMSEAGFWPFRLLDLRQEWDSIAINDVEDSYGQEWVRRLFYYVHIDHMHKIYMFELLSISHSRSISTIYIQYMQYTVYFYQVYKSY